MTSTTARQIIVVSGLVRDSRGQVLLTEHAERGWELPQGRLEEGEDLVTALQREIHEETGVTIDPGPLAAIWSKTDPPAALIFAFLANWLSGTPRAEAETLRATWFTPEEARARVTHPVNLDRLETVLAYRGTLLYRTYTVRPFLIRATHTLG